MSDDPYRHVVDGVECVHKPQPNDRPGHYPSRRGLVIENPVTRDNWDWDLDEQEAASEAKWWAERKAEQAVCPHKDIETRWIEIRQHTIWTCLTCRDGGVVGKPGTYSHPAPSWEDILRDPTSQMDKDGVVARSILDWQDRTMCGQNIPVTSNTASATFSPRPPSFYVCTKPRPCPDHDVTGGSTPIPTEATAQNATSRLGTPNRNLLGPENAPEASP